MLRNEVKAVDQQIETALTTICAPIHARLRRHPTLRPESLHDIARAYDRLIPGRFRIGPVNGTRHKGEFAIQERRACVSWFRHNEWADDEHGLSLCYFVLSVHDSRLRQRWTPFVNVSLHALARRIERSERDPAAIWRDIALLADAGGEGERVNTGEGFWLGKVISVSDEPDRVIKLRSVRTWIFNADG